MRYLITFNNNTPALIVEADTFTAGPSVTFYRDVRTSEGTRPVTVALVRAKDVERVTPVEPETDQKA